MNSPLPHGLCNGFADNDHLLFSYLDFLVILLPSETTPKTLCSKIYTGLIGDPTNHKIVYLSKELGHCKKTL
jgi:hypothetical protein